MTDRRATRRQRGLAQDFANQLAQMAVGWEFMFVGPALVTEPDSGVIWIDVGGRVATVNGRTSEISMTAKLCDWVDEELQRKALERSWVLSAAVTINYNRSQLVGDHNDVNLTADVRIITAYGEAVSEFSNQQGLQH